MWAAMFLNSTNQILQFLVRKIAENIVALKRLFARIFHCLGNHSRVAGCCLIGELVLNALLKLLWRESTRFRSELTLPEIILDDTSATFLLNMKAYEMCTDFGNDYGEPLDHHSFLIAFLGFALTFVQTWFPSELTLPEIILDDTSATFLLNMKAYEMCTDFGNDYGEPLDHHSFLIAFLGFALTFVQTCEEAAKEALLYSYKSAASGFSAKLTPEQVEQISQQPGVLQVVPSRTYQLHGANNLH
ncbi:hypothetical protein VNO80_14509 [Phaseolus coccineus]|uniref:Inhibitor I9 domain-containing protein n=1 Tax=Phaseolus coccineus TaxID=3886 RepID=A0AAN9MN80_PHACN